MRRVYPRPSTSLLTRVLGTVLRRASLSLVGQGFLRQFPSRVLSLSKALLKGRLPRMTRRANLILYLAVFLLAVSIGLLVFTRTASAVTLFTDNFNRADSSTLGTPSGVGVSSSAAHAPTTNITVIRTESRANRPSFLRKILTCISPRQGCIG